LGYCFNIVLLFIFNLFTCKPSPVIFLVLILEILIYTPVFIVSQEYNFTWNVETHFYMCYSFHMHHNTQCILSFYFKESCILRKLVIFFLLQICWQYSLLCSFYLKMFLFHFHSCRVFSPKYYICVDRQDFSFQHF
jgi:hypothetical protein